MPPDRDFVTTYAHSQHLSLTHIEQNFYRVAMPPCPLEGEVLCITVVSDTFNNNDIIRNSRVIST
jgi:hypothetical protein